MKEIQLNIGYIALIDDEDFERVSQYTWIVKMHYHTFYAKRSIKYNNKSTSQLLHRFILYLSDNNIRVDHIDGNGLNCQKSNMRLATHQQNMFNRRKCQIFTSKYKGVHKSYNKWMAKIRLNNEQKYLGVFGTEEEAAKAYNEAAKTLFGEYACLNNIEESI